MKGIDRSGKLFTADYAVNIRRNRRKGQFNTRLDNCRKGELPSEQT